MTTYSMPTIGFQSASFGLIPNTKRFTSPLSGDTQHLELAGARWLATFTFKTAKRSEAAAVTAFVSNLLGGANTFYGYDPNATTPLGTGSGTPLVNGSNQVGRSLVTDGWATGQTVLKAGDYFTVNGEMKMVSADVTSDGSGNATITFVPALRTSPANNAPLTITSPTCLMVPTDDQQSQWQMDESGFYTIVFNAVETFFA